MSGRSSLWRGIPFVLILGLGIGIFVGLSAMRRPPKQSQPERLAPLVKTVAAARAGSTLDLEAQGEAVPYREVTLSAQVAGRIEEKTAVCQAGHFVEEGCLLINIDPRDYDLEVQRLRESIKETEVRIEESDVQYANNERLVELAKEDLQLQEKELERVRSLVAQRVASQSALETAERAQLQARNALQTLENQSLLISTQRNRFLREKARLLVELDKGLLDRARTEIRAPIAGVVTEDAVEEDDYVQIGTPLVRLEDTSRVEIGFDLKIDELRWIWAGAGGQQKGAAAGGSSAGGSYALPPLPVEVRVQVYGRTFAWQGVLDRYDGAGINPATRTVPCIAVVHDPRGGKFVNASDDQGLPGPPALLRGMFVSVKIAVPTSEPLIELPATALRPGNRVWVMQEDQLSIRRVQPAQVLDDRVLVFPSASELVEGDRVIVSSLPLPINGMKIRATQPSLAEDAADQPRQANQSVTVEVAR